MHNVHLIEEIKKLLYVKSLMHY